MITETFQTLAIATRQTLRKWRTMLLLSALYAALLAGLYLFVTTKEASLSQVALTLVLGLAAPVLFFVIQTIVANNDNDLGLSLLKKCAANLWEVLVITLPIVLVGFIAFYLLAKVQVQLSPDPQSAATEAYNQYRVDWERNAPSSAPEKVHWRVAFLNAIRYLIFFLLLPLVLVQLWISTARYGLKLAIRQFKDHLQNAYSPQSVLIYMCGFSVFAILPYLLLFQSTTSKHAWLEFGLFVGRIAVVFLLTLFGWVVTVQALTLHQSKTQRLDPDGQL